jgi:TatD DNase family protein
LGGSAEGAADRQPAAALPAHRGGSRRCGGRDRERDQLSRRHAPAQLPGLIDSHCHLQDAAFDADRAAVIDRARAAGIERILVPGYDLPSSERAVALAADRPELLHAAVGIHPHYAASTSERDWQRLEALAADPSVAAIGEIGLDFFRNLAPPEAQRAALERQLALASQVHRPVLIHDRDAHVEITAALLDWSGSGRGLRGVLHCFSGDASMAVRLASAGYLISFALPVTFSSAHGPRAAAAALMDGQFLVETDAPWLAPGGGSQRNEPTTVLRVAAELARLRSTTPEGISRDVRQAYDRLVGG